MGQPLLGKEGRAGSSMQGGGGREGAQAYILTGDRKAPPQLWKVLDLNPAEEAEGRV